MLIQCPECQQRISDRARVCPQCGYPIVGSGDPVRDYARDRLRRGSSIALALAIGFGLWGILGLMSSHDLRKHATAAFTYMILCLICFVIGRLRLQNIGRQDQDRD